MTPDLSPRGPTSRRSTPQPRPKAKRMLSFRLDHGSEVIPELVEEGAPRSTEDLKRENLSSIVENHEQIMRTLGGIVAFFAGEYDSDKASSYYESTPLKC